MGEGVLRLAAFAAFLVVFMALEHLRPDRPIDGSTHRRFANLSLGALGALVGRALGPLAPVGVALIAAENGWGLLNAVARPDWLAWIAAFVVLDLALYLQHRAMHRSPFLWRLHAPHHADAHLDVTTALRFHPFEHLVSAAWKSLVVLALGAPALAVAAFEIALNAFALFNHSNVRLPAGLERLLSGLIITPRAHRRHHDRTLGAGALNFGFSVTLWDRVFGTWSAGPDPEAVGLADGPRDPASFVAALRQPFD